MTASTPWRRSSFCADSTCVEVSWSGDEVYLRDGKDTARRPIVFSLAEWREFLDVISPEPPSPR